MIHQLTVAARNEVSVALQDRSNGSFNPCFSRKVMNTYAMVRGKNPDLSDERARRLTTVFLGYEDDDAEVQAVLHAATSAGSQIQQARSQNAAARKPVNHATFLTYSKPLSFSIDGKSLRASWRAGLIEVIRLALLNGRQDLITVPYWAQGSRPKGAGASVCDIDDLGVSFRDQGAQRAWEAIQHIANGLGLSVRLTLCWTRGTRCGQVHTLTSTPPAKSTKRTIRLGLRPRITIEPVGTHH